MPGLSLEARYALVREAERHALESPRIPGTRRLALTPCDARVLRALAFDFHNGRTGRTDCIAPGSLDKWLSYAARLKVCSCQAARIASGLRWPFFSISHSAL